MTEVENVPGPGDDPARADEHLKPTRRPPRAPLWDRLEHVRWLQPAALLLPVLVAGLVLAPRLAPRVFSTDVELVGTPAADNIKAPFDVTVEDAETTERLRGEAEQRLPSVYDFDVRAGTELARRLGEAFALARKRLDRLHEEDPDTADPARLGKTARQRAEVEVERVVDELRPELQKILGTTISQAGLALLKREQFDRSIEQALQQAVTQTGAAPFVDHVATLAGERDRGLTVQRVPSDGSRELFIDKVESIADRESLRLHLAPLIALRLPELEAEEQQSVAALASELMPANLTFNRAATEVARQLTRIAVKPVTITVKKGEMIIRDGERFTPHHLAILAALNRGRGSATTAFVVIGGALVVLVLFGTTFALARKRAWGRRLRHRDLAFLATVFCSALVITRLWLALTVDLQEALAKVPLDVFLFIVPVAAGAMVVRLCVRQDVALIYAIAQSMVLGLMVEAHRGFLYYATVGSVLGVTAVRNLGRRSDLLRAGLWVGVGQTAIATALLVFDGQARLAAYGLAMPAAFMSGLIAAVVALAMTPVVEAVFDYTTNLQLLELANLNHPALKELIVQAPGSYHHSVIVGSIVEAAAEEIGANPLLARVMAYYHDIGKCRNPSYFSENQRDGQNPHDKLKPSMSAMILKRHVDDGIEIAREHRLGEEIMAGIAEHHGTTVIHFFYQKAKEGEDENNPVSESDYRYDHRKPQSREAALVMLGDAVEAAAGSLADPNAARLQGVINRIINLKFSDGQLEECDLTLKDLHKIAKAFGMVLGSIYHGRPEYPGLLSDIAGKKQNGDLDSKPPRRGEAAGLPDETDGADNLKRLGLDGR
ncbi:MAG: HDIG domain-containing protein [Deltaproteobacteria bacterium]|nr:HDIG domain-containing protein [Deltaproteobacteria bacterium]